MKNSRILKFKSIYFILLYLAFQSNAHATSPTTHDNIATQIIKTCQGNDLIILGERHQQADSQKLLLAIVKKWADQGKKVFIGLEIPKDKQEIVNTALTGVPFPDGTLYSSIDYPEYREMVRDLGNLPITVKAIDATDKELNRDQAMNDYLLSIIKLRDYDKILVLVGNLHAVKQMKWHPDTGHAELDNQYLGGRLINSGFEVCSVVQDFSFNKGNPQLIITSSPEGTAAALRVIGSTYHNDNMVGRDVADAVVVW